ncbi:MAG TPA: MarR family transcriptional regulator [Burkholderiales bacterium]
MRRPLEHLEALPGPERLPPPVRRFRRRRPRSVVVKDFASLRFRASTGMLIVSILIISISVKLRSSGAPGLALTSRRKKATAPQVDLEALPGYCIRRLQQIAVAIFLQEAETVGITPVQYAVLQQIANSPGIDQRTLARTAALDTSTLAGVVDRLEARGLVMRNASPDDRRVRLLTLTDAGLALLESAVPRMLRAQERILEPLRKRERAEFMRLVRVLITANNELSRAPSEAV